MAYQSMCELPQIVAINRLVFIQSIISLLIEFVNTNYVYSDGIMVDFKPSYSQSNTANIGHKVLNKIIVCDIIFL